jgi:hypothetical protein
MSEIDPRLAEFIRLFNEKEFFEAHETLEGLWLETEGEDKDFYKGLIQCAVAFVHLERGNFRGARKLYRTASEYLHAYLPVHLGIQVEDLLDAFEEFFATSVPVAERRDEPADLADFDTPVIENAEE